MKKMKKKVLVLIIWNLIFTYQCFAQNFGSQDLTFRPDDIGFGVGIGTSSVISASAIQSDGKLIVAVYSNGTNHSYNESTVKRVFRINTDGSLDKSFNPLISQIGIGGITDVLVKPNGNILISGRMSTQSISNSTIIELNPDGTINRSIGNSYWGNVNHMEYDLNGNITIFGSLSLTYTGNGSDPAASADYVSTISPSGSVLGEDPQNINSNVPFSSIKSVLVDQSNKKIVIGNFFHHLSGNQGYSISEFIGGGRENI